MEERKAVMALISVTFKGPLRGGPAALKIFPGGDSASEGTLEFIAAVDVVDRHSAHHIGRERNQSASTSDGVDKSRNKEERAEPDEIVDIFHRYSPLYFAAAR